MSHNSSHHNEGPRETAGLRFACTRCSACCRFDSGYVWLSRSDLDTLCAGLRLPETEVIKRYCRIVDLGIVKRLSLAEQANLDCVFWQNGACSVYRNRPLQCRSFPFWSSYTEDAAGWRSVAEICPGVGVGRLHSRAETDAWLTKRLHEPPLDVAGFDGAGRPVFE